MSFKIVDVIKKTKGISGKHKRVLEAWASYGNKDGTNIFASKDAVGNRAGVNRKTVYRNTQELVSLGLLVEANAHVCRVENCNKGRTHFTGVQGHYTIAFNLNVSKIVDSHLSSKCPKVGLHKMSKGGLDKMSKGTFAQNVALPYQ